MADSIKRMLICVLISGLFLLCGCLNDPEDGEDLPPTILVEPQSKAAMYGDTIAFKVSVAYDPLVDFQWFKSDTMISYAKDSVLVLTNVTFADTGEYFVFVSNRSGYVLSRRVRVFVSGGQPVVANLPAYNALNVKDSIALTAQVAGYPPFQYQWYRNQISIPGAVDSVYTISSFTEIDSGRYSVVVKNSIGVDTSNVARVYKGGILFIAETDFNSGYVEWMSIKTNKITSGSLAVHHDMVIRSFGGYVYILECLGTDNVIKYDPSKNSITGILYQKKLGDNWNPQDIEFVSETKAYISNMNEPKITVFDPSTGTFSGNIDISEYTFMPDSNVSPYAGDLQLVGTDLYVLLQRRNGFSPGGQTVLLKINTVTNEITDSVTLKYRNGYAMRYNDGALYITNPGDGYTIGDGGIEKVDLATKQVTELFSETLLGGNPNEIVYKSKDRFYITNYIGWMNVKVLEIDVATRTIVDTLDGVKDAFGGICYDAVSERLFVGERDDVEMGVKIFENNKQIGSTVRTANTLAPSGFAIVR
ncbi:MAG: immunoglobulin domain-containing protein [Chitinispirillaceae bacterium]|nr:immunoglobulin domain-containing protein [Chitinispirillaceae bacterium]